MDTIAQTILKALNSKQQIAPITDTVPDFDLKSAYAVSDAILSARIAYGFKPAGWKIGFTNRTIWNEYGVHAPVWGPMYDRTIRALDANDPATRGNHVAELDIGALVEPRIEPEIVFRMARPPRSDMNDLALLSCIDAVAHGYELVQSVYPGWKFTAADTVAAGALHGTLVHGPMVSLDNLDAKEWLDKLARFEIILYRNEEWVDAGTATNVLGGPLSALRHFIAGMEKIPMQRSIVPGDLVTTGTVTRAFPVEAGDIWSTSLSHLPLSGMRLRMSCGATKDRELESSSTP